MTSMTTLEDIVARIGVKMEALADSQKDMVRSFTETERVLREQNAETDRFLKERTADMDRVLTGKISDLSDVVSDLSDVVSDLSDKVSEITDKVSSLTDKVSEISDEVSGLSKEVNKWVGRFGNKMGYLIEKILIPGIMPKMNTYGHHFTALGPDKEFYLDSNRGRRFAEVDLFLEDGDEAMAIEVKTQLRKDDVEYHLKRLKLLRENEAVSGLRGKTLYSAMAGLQIDDDAREMALNLGMYLIEMVEDTKYVNVIKPVVELGKW